MAYVIGIDLGTTNSVVSVMEGGDPVVIPNQEAVGLRRTAAQGTAAGGAASTRTGHNDGDVITRTRAWAVSRRRTVAMRVAEYRDELVGQVWIGFVRLCAPALHSCGRARKRRLLAAARCLRVIAVEFARLLSFRSGRP
jgi:hypothetical protein